MYSDEDLQATGAQIRDPGDRFPYLLLNGENEAMCFYTYLSERRFYNGSAEEEAQVEALFKEDVAFLRVERFIRTVLGFYLVCFHRFCCASYF